MGREPHSLVKLDLWRWAPWLIALLPLLGWWATGLTDLDEGFYGAVTREMITRHEWITPLYNGSPWFEKPILLYWVAKPCVMLFGDAVGPRLPSVLAALGLYALIAHFGRKWYGAATGTLAMLICATSLLWVALGRLMMTDALFVLCLSAAILCFYDSLNGSMPMRWASAACLGLSVLAKGPVGAILFVLIFGVLYWRERDLRRGFAGGWIVGLLIFAAVVASWYVPCWLANREQFVQKFLIEQNIGRFQGGDKAHALGFPLRLIHYPVVLAVGMAPWIWRIRRSWPTSNPIDAPLRFCAVWALMIFGFFFASGSQLPHYIAPCIPPLSLILAARLTAVRSSDVDASLLKFPAMLSAGMCLLANTVFVLWYGGSFSNDSYVELHNLARATRTKPGAVIAYQFSRRQADRGTGKLEIQQTSHPSLAFYLAHPFVTAEAPSDVAKQEMPCWLITRPDRIDARAEREFELLGIRLDPDPQSEGMKSYRLYMVSRRRAIQ